MALVPLLCLGKDFKNSYLIKATLDQSLLMLIIQYNNDIWFAESYMLHGNSLKLTYLILCGKAFLYAILVCTLMLTAKVGLCITSKVILFTSTSIRQNLLSGMECSPYTLQSYVLPCLKNHKCWIFYYCSSTSQTKSVLTQQFLLEIFFKHMEKEEQLCTTHPESKKMKYHIYHTFL